MPAVAVVAHSRKSLGGGLPELRKVLAADGVTDPLWYQVKESRRAPRHARRAAAQGAEVIFVWAAAVQGSGLTARTGGHVGDPGAPDRRAHARSGRDLRSGRLRSRPAGRDLTRNSRAHDTIRGMIRETDLQLPGSPLWWHLATTSLAAWSVEADGEYGGLPADRSRRAGRRPAS